MRSDGKCPFLSWGPFSPCGQLHIVLGHLGTVGKDPEPFWGPGGWGEGNSSLQLAGGTLERSDPVRRPSSCEELCRSWASFCLSPSWIPLEDLTHSKPTSNPGIPLVPCISTWSSASSVLSRGHKLQRHFLCQVPCCREPGSVG